MRHYLWLSILLGACGSVELQHDALPCTDVDLGAEPDMYIEEDGADLLVFLKPVWVGADDAFQPTYNSGGKTLGIYEQWAVGPDPQQACRMPTVRLVSPPSGTWSFSWYLEGELVPEFEDEYEL